MSGAIEFGAMISIGWGWRFGLRFEMYTTGTSGHLGLGPISFRWFVTSTKTNDGRSINFFIVDTAWAGLNTFGTPIEQ